MRKVIIYSVAALVILSIFLASYLDDDNTLKDEAVRMGDSYYCEKIETQFIKDDCFEIVEQKLQLLQKCHKEHGQFAKECNSLAY